MPFQRIMLDSTAPVEDIIAAVEQEFQGRGTLRKRATLYLLHRYSGLSLREIGRHFSIAESAVSQASRRFQVSIADDENLQEQINRVCKALNMSNE